MTRWMILILLCGLLGCRTDMGLKAPDDDSLGSLHTRDHVIRLEAGQRYSVFTADGQMLAQSLDVAQFQQQFPDLYEDLEKAVADTTSTDQGMLEGRR